LKNKLLRALFAFLPVFLVCACAQNFSLVSTQTQIPIVSVTPPIFFTDTQTSIPSTEFPSLTPTTTPTLFPLSIEAMRTREYPGSSITIEKKLLPGSNYNRYIASYLSEGLTIYSFLTVPSGEQPATGWPVVIFNHGYIPPDEYRITERYIYYIDRLAQAGYIVFMSDYRGHDHSEGVARGAYGFPDYVVDVLNGLQSMKTFPGADPSRIGMWGHSMGGYITLRAMVIRNEINAGVIWAGVVGSYSEILTDWPQITPPIYELDPSWRIKFVDEFGTPEQNPGFWDSISASSYLNDISGPLQLQHSMADAVVPFEFSNKLFHELIIAGKVTEFFVYKDDNHNLSNNLILAMDRTIEFFDRYVKGK
jgi:dipeptidyl aminopeptidase/acylaminoacyl peptidase